MSAVQPRFEMTYCSQCGCECGPGDAGFSNCSDHIRMQSMKNGSKPPEPYDVLRWQRAKLIELLAAADILFAPLCRDSTSVLWLHDVRIVLASLNDT